MYDTLPLMNKTVIASLFMLVSTLSAAVIVSPVSGVVNSGGTDPSTSLSSSFNRSGLSSVFTSGVTDFDTYLASNPTHSLDFTGEWFSASGTSTATVTYDLGSALLIDRLALWNEESSGIGLLNLLYSTDSISFNPLVSNVVPPDNPLANYPASVIGFGGAVNARYVRFNMSNCPQANPGTFSGCAIGEVAFSSAGASGVPEPSSLVLIGLGLSGLIAMRFRKSSLRT